MTRTRWLVAGAVVLVSATIVITRLVASSTANNEIASAQEPSATTAVVERGPLSAMVSLSGTLTHRARSDGSPYPVINQAPGIYTELPEVGREVACGDVLLRVDVRPVVLLCGPVPAFRELRAGVVGDDVRQLNANLHQLGYDAAAGVDIDPNDGAFTERTQRALERLQAATAADATGVLAMGAVVFLPEPVRIAQVSGELGGTAQSGAGVLTATSGVLEVQVDLDAGQQRDVEVGARARITLPGNRSVTGVVDRRGTVAELPSQQGSAGPGGVGAATVRASITLDDPTAAHGLDHAPVQVDIATEGVQDALNVPVTAVVGRSGGGFAVEVLRDSGRRELAPVKLGLFDTTAGRVQIEGDVREGDRVVVPTP